MAATTERAIPAEACFLGMPAVGAALARRRLDAGRPSGGDLKKATYRNDGAHAELRWRLAGLRLADGV